MKVKAAIISSGAITLDEGAVDVSYEEIQERFWAALQTLTKSDCIYLSRTIGVCPSSIEKWKYGSVFLADILYKIFSTIEWAENGKITDKIDDEEFIPWLN